MAEQLILNTPVTPPSTTSYRVSKLSIDRLSFVVIIDVVSQLNKTLTFRYSGAVGEQYIKFLNTGNFTSVSMHKRILERLVTDGKLPAGTVTGAPE